MRLKPLNWKIFIEPTPDGEGMDLPETLASIGLTIRRGMSEDEIRRSVASDDVGTVVALGPLCWQRQDLQGNKPPQDWEPWCKVGDKVIYGKHAGKLKQDPASGKWFMLVNDEDIQAVIEPDDFSEVEAQLEELEHV
jgi:co-chaperonin GroES (HSP10)